LKPRPKHRIIFDISPNEDLIPYDSLICIVSAVAHGGEVVINDMEQK